MRERRFFRLQCYSRTGLPTHSEAIDASREGLLLIVQRLLRNHEVVAVQGYELTLGWAPVYALCRRTHSIEDLADLVAKAWASAGAESQVLAREEGGR